MPFSFGKQLELALPSPNRDDAIPDASDLEAHRLRISGYLSVRLPEPVDVVFTTNKSTMLSFKKRSGRYAVRLHRVFRLAESRVLEALARYMLTNEKNASRVLDEFIASKKDEIRSHAQPRHMTLHTKGRHHDLVTVLKKVSRTYFGGEMDVRIGWGRRPRKRTGRRVRTLSRALATYNYIDRVIRVSPVLDGRAVPGYVVEWVVYHELLHHVLPVEESGGKKRYHTDRFKALERAFAHYEEAKAWEEAHLDRLLF